MSSRCGGSLGQCCHPNQTLRSPTAECRLICLPEPCLAWCMAQEAGSPQAVFRGPPAVHQVKVELAVGWGPVRCVCCP